MYDVGVAKCGTDGIEPNYKKEECVMFQKKDYIFSESLGVCRVDDVTKINARGGESPMYYVLRSHYDKSKVSYIPVEGHQVSLRELRTKEEIEALLANTPKEKLTKEEQGEADFVLGKN